MRLQGSSLWETFGASIVPAGMILASKVSPKVSSQGRSLLQKFPTWMILALSLCMTRSSNKELVEPYDEPEEVKEEITETIMEPAMEEYMKKTREDYESCVARPKFDKDAKFELKGVTIDQLMLRVFPITLTGAALRNVPASSITTWEILKGNFLSKYCPPSCTAKKMEEINNF
ncbi:hypothetical protein Tco_0859943 [Tanacetum coccineum]|uniref:Uncharacterized protein n=1 Tax=Tanacetum coccineum TaxID=301880 RepID=A0ABQ5BH07_9ASTR